MTQTVLVTGAAGGIGRATVALFHTRGWHVIGVDRAELIANGGRALTVEQAEAIDALAARRLKREPVARIFGHKEFWSLSLQIGPAVLVPRPETETVVEAALDAVARGAPPMTQLRILDIGTG